MADSAELSTGTDQPDQHPARESPPANDPDQPATTGQFGIDQLGAGEPGADELGGGEPGTDERGAGELGPYELAAVPVVERQVAQAGRAATDRRREAEPRPEHGEEPDWEFGRDVGVGCDGGDGGDGRNASDGRNVGDDRGDDPLDGGPDPTAADGARGVSDAAGGPGEGARGEVDDGQARRHHPVARHYTRSALLSTLLDALAAAGKACDPIDSNDLSAVDELHTGGRAATVELADLLAPPSGAHLLDLGCGLGGPARYLARHRGCRVTGVDLSREYVDLATELTERCGLGELAEFSESEVTALPFADESFDAAVLMHVGMNVPDKARLCAEAYRVLRPGGRFAVYDVMLTGDDGELTYPLPWASNAQVSFLESPAEYRWQLTEAGFTVEEGQDPLDPAGELLRRLAARDDDPSTLGPHVVMGESYRAKVANLADALRRDLVTPMRLVGTK